VGEGAGVDEASSRHVPCLHRTPEVFRDYQEVVQNVPVPQQHVVKPTSQASQGAHGSGTQVPRQNMAHGIASILY
jgi:hypothetical protein